MASTSRTLFVLGILTVSLPAEARRYPITRSDASGSWVGLRHGLLLGRGELWKRFDQKSGLPHAQVNDVELTARSVWVATPAGLARMDKGSRRWETFSTPDLPSSEVTGVSTDSSDPDHVWVSTLGGLAHYNVRTNSWTQLGRAQGLPSRRVNDVLFRGRTVWAATDTGLAAFDVKRRVFTLFSAKDGLAGGPVLEVDEIGTDLWLSCGQGLSRMNLQRRTFAPFRQKEGMPGTDVIALARMQTLIYIVTEGGLITYDTAADALAPFLHLKGLQGAKVRSVVAAGGFVWFGSDQGIARFEPTKKTWEYYKVEDGLSSDDVERVTVSGSLLLVLSKDGEADTYDYKKDEWMERYGLLPDKDDDDEDEDAGEGEGGDKPVEKKEEKGFDYSASAELDTELSQGLAWNLTKEEFERDGLFKINKLRLGAGARWGAGRSVDLSGKLDWGDIDDVFSGETDTLGKFQRYDFRLRYLGARDDYLREVIATDELRLEFDGGRLTERTELEGGRAVADLGPKRAGGHRLVRLQASAGLRRGTPWRVVKRRPDAETLELKGFKLGKRYIIPSSVRAELDGRELERNVDYFIDHEVGMFWLKNTDLMHALRVFEVEFEYEQIPHKDVGMTSATDLVPRDGDIGQIKRSGQYRWAKDEQGLFDEIDGGAEQYINRGWQETLSQDLEWGSSGVILRIHAMGGDDDLEDGVSKNARSILRARLLPEAKPVPGLKDAYLEKQAASLTVKMVRRHAGLERSYFIEFSIDQPTMEQEIIAIAYWLSGKFSGSGGTSADALRDITVAPSVTVRLSDNTRIGVDYIGTRSRDDQAVREAHKATSLRRDVLAVYAAHERDFGENTKLSARFQAAASSGQEEGRDRDSGSALRGEALLTSPYLTVRARARKYTHDFRGIGAARQTEFCRDASGQCAKRGTSQLDHQIGVNAEVTALSWLPLSLTWQRQNTRLGSDYDDAPSDRGRVGLRDVALARLVFARAGLPRLSVEGGYIRRDDALAEQDQLRLGGTLEADLADGLLKVLKFKKIYLRGLYEYGDNAVDEFRAISAAELDRDETMHHGVAELRLAPTLTENGYFTLEYHGLRGVVDRSGQLVDRATFWRIDAGAGSSVVPGLAARLETRFDFGDDMPLPSRFTPDATPTTASLTVDDLASKRTQESSARYSAVVDLFPGEWLDKLAPLKVNLAYTYTRDRAAEPGQNQSVSGTVAPFGEEVCEVVGDEDGDGLSDCQDPDCRFADVCLRLTSDGETHRAYGTAHWDTPGKLQAELYGDIRRTISGKDRAVALEREELRSYVTWRPVYTSPITLRFDMTHEAKPSSDSSDITEKRYHFEPALEWRRRWSVRWWHLTKVTVAYQTNRNVTHKVTNDPLSAGAVEQWDYDELAVTPSLELRHRIEDPKGLWNLRPYLRLSYKLKFGLGVESRVKSMLCGPDDACFVDGSETSRTLAFTLGLLWIHSDILFVDLDLTTGWYDCDKKPGVCEDKVTFTPRLLATVRY